jgi:hypothetical protein
MGPAATVLARKIKLWYMANEPRPSPMPEFKADANLPASPPDNIVPDSTIGIQLSGLRAFEDTHWDGVSRDLSGLLSRLSDISRQRLLESLSLISSPPPIEPLLARRWIWSVSSLLPSTYPTAIMEFFQLAWMWDQIHSVAGIDLEVVLALFYKALRSVGEGPRSAAMIHFLIQLAGRWPERFCYWLERTADAGPDVIQALKRAEAIMPEAAPYARETLLDFAAEMGWRFLGDDDLPLWKAIGRLGEMLFRRLRGMAIPASSLQLLSGVLGELEKSGMDEMIAEVRSRVVEGMFGEHDRAVIDEALASVPEVYKALEAVGEMELIAQVTELHGALSQPLKTGAGMVRLAAVAAGGRLEMSALLGLFERFEGQINEPQILGAMELVAGLRPPIPRHPPESWMRMLRLLGSAGAAEGETSRPLRNAVGRVFEALVASPDSDAALTAVEKTLTIPTLAPADVFTAASFLLRSASVGQAGAVLSRTSQTAILLSLLGPAEKEKLLAGLPPPWLVSLASEDTGALGMVTTAVEKLRDRSLRLRFLEKIVAPMLEELPGRGGVFEEYLTAAAIEYNKVGSQGAIREAEHDLLQRLFRTGDRTKAIEDAISELLQMPGLEGDRAGNLIASVKTLCSAFGRLSVWQETSDSTLPSFLQKGLPRLVRASVDFPEVLDTFAGDRMQAIVDKLMPSAGGPEPDPQVARWQMKTGVVYFGQVLPLAIELFPHDLKKLSAFAESICDQAVRTTQGLVAGAGYLSEAALRLEQHLIENYTVRFQALVEGKAAETSSFSPTWTVDVYESWNRSRAAEAALVRDTAQIARALTPDKKLQRLFAHEARKLWEGMSRAGLLTKPLLLRQPVAQGVQQLMDIGGGDLLEVIRILERGEGISSGGLADKAEKFFSKRTPGPSGENPCRMWRLEAFAPLGSCLVNLVLLDGAKPSAIDQLVESFLEVAEFLGTETGGDELLLAFERCLSLGESGKPPSGVRDALRAVEKQLFRPLWRRRAMSRVELLVAGLGDREKLVDSLLNRLSKDSTGIVAQVRFLRKFGQLFLTVEEASLKLGDRRQTLHVHDSLNDVWIFSGNGRPGDSAADSAREGFEAATEVFRTLLRRAGAVTAEEAEEISIEMRRRYRDNAEVVAILLRWTLEPSREDLLTILENNPPLLEAAGRDTELTHLLDTKVRDARSLEIVRELADNPVLMKAKLQELS